ncbi:MAG: MiaB/RimO family radical SAM methylthiotransferase [Christensenellaceae bacterium]|jgi:threonylcarbamoyladenosine tRNA methylthiotransferase MtaB|nr:MiaB/RimO family radical SAM methylthiotransferase [Christensenellaceae bacterium]
MTDLNVIPSAVVFNIGCKSNQYDCDMITAELIKRGYLVYDRLEVADIYITNTCAVTNTAESKSRQIISRIRNLNPNAKIYVFGCATVKNATFYNEAGISFVGGIDYAEVIRALDSQRIEQSKSSLIPTSLRTRAYVKIQDGCDNFCSYCVVSRLRGIPRSKPVSIASQEIISVSENTSEIVITGINLSLYGRDHNETLEELITKIKPVKSRIRLSSFYSKGINRNLLDALFNLNNFSPHFHLSLQHGDSNILKDMQRGYTTDEFQSKVNLIREYDKNAAITTDIIVGYPTESDESFIKSCDFAKAMRFANIHIFPFSSRPQTPAALLKKVQPEVIKDRCRVLALVNENLKKNYLTSQLDMNQTVIFEKFGEVSEGYSQYYIRTYAITNKKIAIVRPLALHKKGIIGDIV